MCGRYAASKDVAELVELLDVEQDATGEPTRGVARAEPGAGVSPDYNMAPTKAAPVVLTRRPRGASAGDDAEPVRQLRLLTWGLVPSWAKDVTVGVRMINARAETLLDKPAYARAARARRCLVPADGYYEWQQSPTACDAKGKPRKQPFFISRADGQPLVMAGVYELWRDRTLPDGDPASWLTTYAVITTAAEPGLDTIHDRQPLVLDPEQWAAWLDPERTGDEHVRGMIEGQRPGRFDACPVSTAVNDVRNNGPQLLAPAPADQLVGVVDPATGEVR
ncbi:SOS response-associated peptidase [Arsenicicoccus dermatophilus]|uniref:SOS response-associated peptidase n=1 Tax=Arsenicicoccus dermatophilus TaxID=1076331 RepID=UPI001F4CAB70|nr:SOS response-associated peptidase [Arsenicicoccus dermatophilus]MCH8613620.1 SOS response-associated peptidase [Arsenicicoccus dermatophilus]